MSRLPLNLIATFVAAGLPALAASADEAMPRRELAPFEQALAEAISRVSQAAVPPVLGLADVCRGYRMPGFGAMFVVSPRYVPVRIAMRNQMSQADVAKADGDLKREIAAMEGELQTAKTDEQKRHLTTRLGEMKQQRRRLRDRALEEQQLKEDLQEWKRQVQIMNYEAQQARQEMEQIMRWLQERVGAPARPDSSAVGAASSHRPPWVAWLDGTTPIAELGDTRRPQEVLEQVRQVIVGVLEQHGASLASLEPSEVVAVAVDFIGTPSPDMTQAQSRTLVVRVAKSVLDARRAGTLSAEEARKQFQVQEY